MDTESAPTPRWLYCDRCACVHCGRGFWPVDEIAAITQAGGIWPCDTEHRMLCPAEDCDGLLQRWPRRGTKPASVCKVCAEKGNTARPPVIVVPAEDKADESTVAYANRLFRTIRGLIVRHARRDAA